jgi:hypothetical protein
MSPKLYIPLIVLAVVAVGLGVYDYRYIINPPKNAGVQPIVAMPQFEAVSTSSPVVVTHTRAKGMDNILELPLARQTAHRCRCAHKQYLANRHNSTCF